jgi:hypothetical protein
MTVDNKLINNAIFFSQTSKRKVQDTGELSGAIFFLFFWEPFLACSDPDPDSQPGSRSTDPIESGFYPDQIPGSETLIMLARLTVRCALVGMCWWPACWELMNSVSPPLPS